MPLPAYNVTTYLTARLAQLGIRQLFAVPGDYTSDFLELIDEQGLVQRIGNCNELNAGYAADGYARANGIGAVAITTGVGSSSVLNAIAGCYVEMVPVILVIGTLSNQKLIAETSAAELFHHNLRLGGDQNKDMFADCTVAFERISNPNLAPAQIDRALTACLSQSRPVAIEIMEDCYAMPCDAPVGTLAPVPPYVSFETLQGIAGSPTPTPATRYAKGIVNAVTTAAQQTYNLLMAAHAPVLWLGKEVTVYGVEDEVQELIQTLNLAWADSLLGKAVLAEDFGAYLGLYDGALTPAPTLQAINYSDCLVALGVWNTDLNEFAPASAPAKLPQVWACQNWVKIAGSASAGATTFNQVSLVNFLSALLALVRAGSGRTGGKPARTPPPKTGAKPAAVDSPITYDTFRDGLNGFINATNLIVADIGLSTFGVSSYLTITRPGGFLCPAIWAPIGWSVPAVLGASFTPGTRAIGIVGDGAFKLTCQEISTMAKFKLNPVIFVLNNGVYGVEEILDNPATYANKTPFEAANVLQPWNYASLLAAFSNGSGNAMNMAVNTVGDLQSAFTQIAANPNALWLINVNLNAYDYPASWAPFVPAPAKR